MMESNYLILINFQKRNEMKKFVYVILTLSFNIFAQYEWSEPVQLSETGNYPEIRYQYPAIAVDNNGNLHAFWVKSIEYETLTWYSQIEYRKSTDGGLTWSATVNLTPEYNFYRIVEIQAVCDSQNNVHLFYLRGNSPYKVLHKKYNGSVWSEPYEISPYATINLRTGIDKNDRIYLTWYYGTSYYTYCDIADTLPEWRTATKISDENIGVNSFFVFDENCNLYSVGRTVNPRYPYFFKYDEQNSTWTLKKMFNISASGEALVISKDNYFYSNLSTGTTDDDNSNFETFKTFNDSLWSDLNYVNSNNEWDYKRLFTDKNDNQHLFEMHYGDIKTSLIYSTKQNGTWSVNPIQADSTYNYAYFNVAYKIDEKFYIVYNKITSESTQIMFQAKQIDTGIENDPENFASSPELYQNYPNPFNNETQIQFNIEKTSLVELCIYNSKGELVKNLVSDKLNKGKHNFAFKADGINSGVYFYKLSVDGVAKETKKMLYLR